MKIINAKCLVFVCLLIIGPLIYPVSPDEVTKKKTRRPARNYHVIEADSKIKIDGRLEEKAWQEAEIINLPYEWTPGDNTPAPVKTECMVTFSKTKLYIAFRCFDPDPDRIRAHLMVRDDVNGFIQDDFVCVTIDTFNDERRGFEFVVNPLGVQADALFSELDGSQDFTWDAIWDSAGKITRYGYVVELAVPFYQLRFPHTKPNEKQTWGFSIERSYPRNTNHIMISHYKDRSISCVFCQSNKISGFAGLSQGRNFELDPTLTLNRTDRQVELPGAEMETGKIETQPGLTVRWGITPNSVLNAAVNPDFSHVEADVAQLEVNTRFALYYPEKRPFFLEGKDFFYTPLEAIFTRTVFDPLWGVKMTGKMGKTAVGILSNQDRFNNLLFPSNQDSQQVSLEENVYSGVVRLRRDIGKGSTLGLLYTGRISDNYYNHVVGADGYLRLSGSKDISFQYLRSFSQYPGETAREMAQPVDPFSGQALYAKFKHLNRHLFFEAVYEDLSPQFRADYGFVPRVDTRRASVQIEPVIWPKKEKWFDRISFVLRGENITDHENTLTDRTLQATFNYFGPFLTLIQSDFITRKEIYNDIPFQLARWQTLFQTRPVGSLNCSIFVGFGDTIDYFNTRKSGSLLLNSGIDWRINRHFNANLNHIYERVTFKKEHVYTANLLQARLAYHFNVKMVFRAIVQYTHISRSPDLYILPVDAETRSLFTQFLFSYRLNPQTVLFLGYSDDWSGANTIPLGRNSRTFFLKIGYALPL